MVDINLDLQEQHESLRKGKGSVDRREDEYEHTLDQLNFFLCFVSAVVSDISVFEFERYQHYYATLDKTTQVRECDVIYLYKIFLAAFDTSALNTIEGFTNKSILHAISLRITNRQISSTDAARVAGKLKGVKILVIDEVSLLALQDLIDIDSRLKSARKAVAVP